MEGCDDTSSPTLRRRNAVVLAAVAVVWFALDQVLKRLLDGAYATGEHIAGPFAGVVQFTLVHNTGMAWGLLSDSTLALGVFSLAVCAVVAALVLGASPNANLVLVLGGALVVAGGLGNALDRFALGYVVDFIDPVFIDFPVFNVADIGVTCGCVLFVAGVLIDDRRAAREERASAHPSAAAEAVCSEGAAEGGAEATAGADACALPPEPMAASAEDAPATCDDVPSPAPCACDDAPSEAR